MRADNVMRTVAIGAAGGWSGVISCSGFAMHTFGVNRSDVVMAGGAIDRLEIFRMGKFRFDQIDVAIDAVRAAMNGGGEFILVDIKRYFLSIAFSS